MKNSVLKPFWTAMFLAALLLGSAHAGASSAVSGEKPAASAKKKTKTGASGQVRFLPGSAETTKYDIFHFCLPVSTNLRRNALAGSHE